MAAAPLMPLALWVRQTISQHHSEPEAARYRSSLKPANHASHEVSWPLALDMRLMKHYTRHTVTSRFRDVVLAGHYERPQEQVGFESLTVLEGARNWPLISAASAACFGKR